MFIFEDDSVAGVQLPLVLLMYTCIQLQLQQKWFFCQGNFDKIFCLKLLIITSTLKLKMQELTI